jgi:UDP-GlcNAc:undecaprenyl-phosphate GlcNAc-1-phosphate transferase
MVFGVFVGTMVSSLILTLLIRAVAPRVGLTDRPDGQRKLHRKETPLGGGLAIFVATAAAVLTLLFFPNPWQANLVPHTRALLGMLAAALAIVILGLVDDRFRLRGRHKLVGQVAVAVSLAVNGLDLTQISILGYNLPLGNLTVPVTVIWLLGTMNAINLLDGIDGLATLLGVVLSATFACVACLLGHPGIAIVAMVFAAALLGFACFNFPPATIFLGDTGSMLIGLVLGILAVKGSLTGTGTLMLAVPLAIWTLPLFDSVVAILRRRLTGRSIYTPDRGHLHHCLMERLGSSSRVLWLVGTCTAVTALAAIGSVLLQNDLVAILVVSAAIGTFIATGLFGRAEFRLLVGRTQGFFRSFLRLQGRPAATVTSVRLQGSIQWQRIWSGLTEAAERLNLRQICLDINIPLLHEGFHADWQRTTEDDGQTQWQITMPLMVNGIRMGRVEVISQSRVQSVEAEVAPLLDVIDTCESLLQAAVVQSQLKAKLLSDRKNRYSRLRTRSKAS